MSKMKSMLGFAAMMAALAYGENSGTTPSFREPRETEEERKERLRKSEAERFKARGLTEFSYPGGTVWALNRKSADAKAKKKGLLQ